MDAELWRGEDVDSLRLKFRAEIWAIGVARRGVLSRRQRAIEDMLVFASIVKFEMGVAGDRSLWPNLRIALTSALDARGLASAGPVSDPRCRSICGALWCRSHVAALADCLQHIAKHTFHVITNGLATIRTSKVPLSTRPNSRKSRTSTSKQGN